MSEARAAIAARKTEDPRWEPPRELIAALDEAEARRRIANAADNGQWRTVLTTATDTPNLLTCANVDTLWRVAEAFMRTEQADRARDVYIYIVTKCADAGERLATVQKALDLLPEERIGELLKHEQSGEFAPIRDELARRRVARASQDPKLIASADDLAVAERLALASAEPANALMLGWYHYRHADFTKAVPWFKAALERNGGPKAAEGHVLSLHALKRFLEAEAIAYEWRDKTQENMRAYLEVVAALFSVDPPLKVPVPTVQRVVPVVVQEQNANAAQGLGWFAFNTCQTRSSEAWFEMALGWKPDEEPAAYGLAVSRLRLNDMSGVRAIMRTWQTRSERIANLLTRRERSVSPCDRLPPGRNRTQASPQGAPPVGSEDPIATGSVAGERPADPPVSIPRPDAGARETRAVPEAILARRADVALEAGAEPPAAFASGGSRGQDSGTTTAAARVSGGRCGAPRAIRTLSPQAALTLGWCLMEADRPLEAAPAFQQAAELGDARIRQEAAYGRTLAYLRKDLTAQAAVAATDAPQSRQRNAELNATVLAQRALAAFRDGRYVEAILALDDRARFAPEQNDLLILRGYSYLRLGRARDAETIFRAVQRTGGGDEATAGLAAVAETSGQFR